MPPARRIIGKDAQRKKNAPHGRSFFCCRLLLSQRPAVPPYFAAVAGITDSIASRIGFMAVS